MTGSVKVRVRVLPGGRVEELELARGSRVADIVARLGLAVSGVVVLREGSPVPEDEVVEEGEYTVLLAASGG